MAKRIPPGRSPARALALPADHQPRRMLIAGSGLLLFGLAVVGVGSSDAGAAITLIGLVLTIAGIHFFGRLGPDER